MFNRNRKYDWLTWKQPWIQNKAKKKHKQLTSRFLLQNGCYAISRGKSKCCQLFDGSKPSFAMPGIQLVYGGHRWQCPPAGIAYSQVNI